MTRIEAETYQVSISVAGDAREAETICRRFCSEVGLCVSVTPTNYIYSGGSQCGVIVGLINYPRFPASRSEIFGHAEALALRLIAGLYQRSATIQAEDRTVFVSVLPEGSCP